MRMRRKKHLDERLENTKEFFIETDKNLTNVLEAVKDRKLVDFIKVFGNPNPVEMEVGCGKGGFITRLARLNNGVNYVAVELIQNIIVLAAENVKNANLKNVKFMNTGAEYLPRYIKENSLDRIYLNFSPPFPQKTNENRRLTNDRNVLNYKSFLKDGGEVLQKTDDKDFFEFSFEVFKRNGFETIDVSDKINNGEIENVLTEYEEKFRALSMPIYALKAIKK